MRDVVLRVFARTPKHLPRAQRTVHRFRAHQCAHLHSFIYIHFVTSFSRLKMTGDYGEKIAARRKRTAWGGGFTRCEPQL
jgi:hypothetical protein